MARLSTTTTYAAVPNSGSHGAALRAALAGGFSQWTVGAITSFGSGGTLREYFVLSHTAGHEIMIYCSGLDVDKINGIYTPYIPGDPFLDSQDGVIALMYAPDGGFQAALTAAHDPLNQSFWDHITVTLGLREPSRAYRVHEWHDTESASTTLLFMEDTTNEFLCVWCRNTSTLSDHASLHIFANNLYSPLIETSGSKQIHPEGMLWFSLDNTAKPKAVDYFRAVWWNASDDVRDRTTVDLASQFDNFIDIPAGAFPLSDPNILTAYANLQTPLGIPARINSNYVRYVPLNHGHNDKLGTDNNFKFVDGMADSWALPWDNNEANPT
jgi:hypothetical protein